MRLIKPRSAVAYLTRTDWLIYGAGFVGFVGFVLVALVRTLENANVVSMTFAVLAIVVQTRWRADMTGVCGR